MSLPGAAAGECPQCGGDVRLDAGDPLLICPFCRTRLYMTVSGPLKYILSRNGMGCDRPDGVVYLPYWRFRGLKYRVLEGGNVEGGFLDTTVGCHKAERFFPGLGIRPGVGRLRLAAGNAGLVSPARSADEALSLAERRIEHLKKVRPLFHRFIGENQYLLYSPYRLTKNGRGGFSLQDLWDGSTLREIPEKTGRLFSRAAKGGTVENVRFLSLVCPECSASLIASAGAVILICRRCYRAWRAEGAGFLEFRYTVLRPDSVPAGADRFLPFWQVMLTVSGLPFKNRADFRSAIISYQRPPESWKKQPVCLYIPAFKLSPRVFLRVSGNMSLACLEGQQEEARLRRDEQAEAVRLPVREAAQAVKVILAHLLKKRRKLYEMVPGSRLKIRRAELVFFPFRSRQGELVDMISGQAVPANALELGRKI